MKSTLATFCHSSVALGRPVLHEAARVGRRGQPRHDVERRPAELRGIHPVADKRRAQVALHTSVAGRRGEGREITVQHRRGRHERAVVSRIDVRLGPLVAKEEEQAVGLDRSANRHAVLISLQPVVFAGAVRVLRRERIGGVHAVVTEELEGVAAERVRAGLGHGVDRATRVRAILRRHRARLGAEFLHGIGERQRQVQVVVRVVVHRAVEDPGHAERQAAGQRIRLAAVAAAHAAARRVELWLRHRSGKQRQQIGRIAAVQRQLHDALVVHHLADAEVARLDRLRVGSDGNGFLYGAKLQRHRHVRIAVDLQHDAGLDGRAEPLQRDIETIGPDREAGRRNKPSASETTSRLKPVSVCVAVTLAPGSTPPLVSFTVPAIWAVEPTCARDTLTATSTMTSPLSNVRSARLILTLLPKWCTRS